MVWILLQRFATVCLIAAAGVLCQPADARVSAIGLGTTQFSGLAWMLVAFELGPWEEYLMRELAPDLETVRLGPAPHISWLQLDEDAILPEFAIPLVKPAVNVMTFTFEARRTSMGGTLSGPEQSSHGIMFERSLIMTGVNQRLSDSSLLSVSAVFASQEFGQSALDMHERHTALSRNYSSPMHQTYRDVSHGTGVRLALNTELVSGLNFNLAYQSRIGMDEFTSFRGVHGYPADLDIPARAHAGLEVRTTRNSWINLGVSQVYYSDVGAFPSRALPARFNALLGDSTSPEFAWNDLTVYSMGWRWRHASDLELSFDYRNRAQPKPTVNSLADALNGELAQNAYLMGISKGVSRNSRLHLNAAYAAPEYAFGGNVLGVVTDRLDQGVEVRARWALEF